MKVGAPGGGVQIATTKDLIQARVCKVGVRYRGLEVRTVGTFCTSLFAPPLAERAPRATNSGCDAGEAADRAVMEPLHVIYHDAQ